MLLLPHSYQRSRHVRAAASTLPAEGGERRTRPKSHLTAAPPSASPPAETPRSVQLSSGESQLTQLGTRFRGNDEKPRAAPWGHTPRLIHVGRLGGRYAPLGLSYTTLLGDGPQLVED